MKMCVIEAAELRSHPRKFGAVKARAQRICRLQAKKGFDPSPAKEVVHDLGLASQDLTQVLAAIRNEGNPLSLKRRGLGLDLILHLGLCQRCLDR